jgi:hypothetical protein
VIGLVRVARELRERITLEAIQLRPARQARRADAAQAALADDGFGHGIGMRPDRIAIDLDLFGRDVGVRLHHLFEREVEVLLEFGFIFDRKAREQRAVFDRQHLPLIERDALAEAVQIEAHGERNEAQIVRGFDLETEETGGVVKSHGGKPLWMKGVQSPHKLL